MLLRGRQGTELELRIVGYEHPAEHVDPWDSNSLLVDVRLVTPAGSWHVVDPCLTTWEADHLVRWLATLAARTDVVGGQLAEPNLTLTASGTAARSRTLDLRACFALETRPPWLGSGDLCVDLTELARDELAAAATTLHEEAARFPRRGDDPTL